ncbi:MAG: hypothetical protein U1G05_00785 [Kiritimatiellia bacterium]
MSESLTLTGLAHLQREIPARPCRRPQAEDRRLGEGGDPPPDNLWDFRARRRQVTPMGEKPTMWNELGNVVGLPASLIAAAAVLDDPAVKARLWELVYSHFDNMFGRNPTGRHFSYDAPREIEGVEFGWYKFLPGGIGRLAEARFVIDGSPKDGHYPYHPGEARLRLDRGLDPVQHALQPQPALPRWREPPLLAREGEEIVARPGPAQLRRREDRDRHRPPHDLNRRRGDRPRQRGVSELPHPDRPHQTRLRLRRQGRRRAAVRPRRNGRVLHGFGYLGTRSPRLGL